MPALAATEGLPAREGQVAAKCTENATGHWRCLTHDEDLAHNFAMHSHTADGAHAVAWVCHVHGPEVP